MDRLRKIKRSEVGIDQELKAFLNRGLPEKFRSVSRSGTELLTLETPLHRRKQFFFQT